MVAVLGSLSAGAELRAEVRQGEYLFGPYGLYSIPLDDYPSPKLDDVPFIDLGSDVKASPGLAGAVDRVMTPNLTIGGEFKYYFGTVDEEVLSDFVWYHVNDLDQVEVLWRTVHFGARARYFINPERKLNPFLQGGLGVYVNKLSVEFRKIQGSGTTNDYPTSESLTDLGVSFGPGALLRITNDTRISVEAILTNVFSSGRNVRYLGFSVGMVFGVTPE